MTKNDLWSINKPRNKCKSEKIVRINSVGLSDITKNKNLGARIFFCLDRGSISGPHDPQCSTVIYVKIRGLFLKN